MNFSMCVGNIHDKASKYALRCECQEAKKKFSLECLSQLL